MNPNEKNEFDRQLEAKFKDFRPPVPGGLWDAITNQLDERHGQGGHAIHAGKGRRLPTRWMSVAATVLMVCGIVYWYNRPVTVTYLQGRAVQAAEVDQPVADTPAPEPAPAAEPLDMERLARVFAKRTRRAENKNRHEPVVADVQHNDVPTEATAPPLPTTDETPPTAATLARNTAPAVEQAAAAERIATTVPDIQPPVVSEEQAETRLASAHERRQPFGISNILNYVVGAVDQREEKLITFSNDNEGSLKLDFNFSLAKNKNKKN